MALRVTTTPLLLARPVVLELVRQLELLVRQLELLVRQPPVVVRPPAVALPRARLQAQPRACPPSGVVVLQPPAALVVVEEAALDF
jgi:hypothetical protein